MLSRFFLHRAFSIIGSRVGDSIRVVFSNGSEYRNYRNGEARLTIIFKNGRAERWSALFFYQGILECYISGDVDIVAEWPVETLADIGRRAVQGGGGGRGAGYAGLLTLNPFMAVRQRLQERRQDNISKEQAKRNAIFHYGYDPKFFELMLGKTVGYSEGLWTPGTKTLDQAKVNNYEYICRKLRLTAGDKVVEVGPGWGFLPIYMVKKYGVSVTLYNPVPMQNEYMRRRFAMYGVADRIELIEGDHRDIAARKGEFDKYVSIGVYEHTGFRKRQYHAWLTSMRDALKPGGIGLISTTSFMDRYMTEFLILKYIFPGGHIPSLPLTLSTMRTAGLSIVDVENLWPHYQKTVAVWRDNVYKHWGAMNALDPHVFNESFRRAWLLYLEGTVDVFEKQMDLSHILFTKGRSADYYPPKEKSAYEEADFVEGDAEPECYGMRT